MDTQSLATVANNTELTFGQKLVDIIHTHRGSESKYLCDLIYENALMGISNASMNAVKFVTFKE